MRSLMLWSLVLCFASVSHSLETTQKTALPHPFAREKRQTAGANILFSSPASGGTYDGVSAYPYTQETVTFTAGSSNVVLTVLVRNDPSFFHYDDFTLTALGDTTNLIQNPGFETGSLAPWFFVGVPGLPAGGEVATANPHTGLHDFFDGAVGGVDGISQVIPTVTGTAYTLSFWVQSDMTIGSGTAALTQVLESDFLPPTDLSLTPATDSGSSATDGITNVGLPVVQGHVAPGQQVNIYINGTLVGHTVSLQSGTFLFQIPTTLTPGTSAVTATAVIGDSESAMSSPLTITYIPSGTPPTLLISPSSDTGLQGDGITSDTSLTLSGQGAPGIVVSIFDGATMLGTATTDNRGAYSFTTSELALGIHSLIANEGFDIAGNPLESTPLDVTVVAPSMAPVLIGLTQATDTGVQGDGMTTDTIVGVTGTAPPNTVVQLYGGPTLLGTATADNAGAFTITTSVLTPGAHTLTATSTNQFGDVSVPSAPLSVSIIPQPPVLLSISSATDTGVPGSLITSDNQVGLVGTALPDSQIELFEDGANIGSETSDGDGSFTVITNPLTLGTHNITAVVVAPGDVTSAPSNAFILTIIAPAPVIVGISAPADTVVPGTNVTTEDPVQIKGTALPNILVVLFENGNIIGSGESDPTGAFTITTSTLSVGDHSIQAEAVVPGNVESTLSASFSLTILAAPTTVQSTDNCVLLGCYKEPRYAQALTAATKIDYNDMSVKKCAAHCSEYMYFGVENSGECFCGNRIVDGTSHSESSNCRSVCGGHPTEFCGGWGYLDLYQCGSVASLSTSSSLSATSSSASTFSTLTSSSTTASFSNSSSLTTSSLSSSSSTSFGSAISSSMPQSVLYSNTTRTPTSSSIGHSTSTLYSLSSPVSVTSTSPYLTSTQLTTSIVYTTFVSTIIKCPITVTNCPADSTVLTTSTIALYTTVCPIAGAGSTNKRTSPASMSASPFAGVSIKPTVSAVTDTSAAAITTVISVLGPNVAVSGNAKSSASLGSGSPVSGPNTVIPSVPKSSSGSASASEPASGSSQPKTSQFIPTNNAKNLHVSLHVVLGIAAGLAFVL